MIAAEPIMEGREELHDIVYAGLGPDILQAERARELHRAVGESADAINAAGYGELFSAIQNAAIGELTLAVAKLFERASDRYPVRSIPAAAALLRKHSSTLPVLEAASSINDFVRADKAFSSLEGLDGSAFSLELADLITATCPDPRKADACGLSRALDALRASRDKAIAHNEAIDRAKLPRAKWAEAEELLDYAKAVTGGLAMAFFSSAYVDDSGYYIRSADARVAATQLRRLLAAGSIANTAI